MAAADLTGSKVEDYEVLSRLGGGGMGVVYEGKGADGRRVAIKTLKPVFADDEEVVGRFLAEARVLKAISHKALVEIFSIGQLGDGSHYFVMEFLEGRTFEDVIKHGAPLEPREVLPWLVEILDALDAVHAHGVIHRDLKPSNLFLARTGVGPQVKLIDFGVAKHTTTRSTHHTSVSAIVGTPDYMSPEQVSGDPVTAASDLYALGCVMFEMLTGELPFADDSEVKKMMMHMERPAPLPSSKVRVPRVVDEVVEWMLQKDPAKRPPSAIALKRRLETLMIELGAHGPAQTTQVPIVRASPPKVTEPEVAALKPEDWPKADFAGVEPTKATPGRKRRTGPVAAPAGGGVNPVVWLVIAGTALLGTGLIVARWTRPKPVQVPEVVTPVPAPAGVEPEKQPTAAPEEPATSEAQPESATPPPPPPPPPIRHKRPPVPPPKHKPPTAAAKDKRHGR